MCGKTPKDEKVFEFQIRTCDKYSRFLAAARPVFQPRLGVDQLLNPAHCDKRFGIHLEVSTGRPPRPSEGHHVIHFNNTSRQATQ